VAPDADECDRAMMRPLVDRMADDDGHGRMSGADEDHSPLIDVMIVVVVVVVVFAVMGCAMMMAVIGDPVEC